MGPVRRFGAAVMMAAMLAGGMTVGSATLEAKGKKGTSDAVCGYLYSVITYPYVTPTIQNYAIQLYLAYGCDESYKPL